jgi:hypothetical protein
MTQTRWTAEQANAWYAQQPWPVGCNFTPSTAINQLEMWQAGSYDPPTIDRELGWASAIGYNCVRVYLHDLLWQADAAGLQARMNHYLGIAEKNGIRTVFCLLDDCWNPNPKLGRQPDPLPGIHNSGWVQSPGIDLVVDPAAWPRLKTYVQGVLDAFRDDPRVLLWDLYNEPGNSKMGDRSLPLLREVFAWAQEVRPSQPISCGVWAPIEGITALQLAASDVITFHNYNEADNLRQQIAELRAYGRPLICTEWMARTRGSLFPTHLPIFKAERVGCLHWGLVAGKTNTIYAWGHPLPDQEPPVWFHDIFRMDGTVYDPQEIAAIRAATGK